MQNEHAMNQNASKLPVRDLPWNNPYTLFFYKNQLHFAEAQLFLIFRLFEAQIIMNLFLIFETQNGRNFSSILTIFHII